jgi:transcriptional regulator with XRE-family HTH domain
MAMKATAPEEVDASMQDLAAKTGTQADVSCDVSSGEGASRVALHCFLGGLMTLGATATNLGHSVYGGPHIGTSSIIVDHRTLVDEGKPKASEVSAPAVEQARLVAALLGMTKSELARVFNVSRPALYAWLSGESEPQGDNADRLRSLATLVRETASGANRPLFNVYVRQPLPGRTSSIRNLLQAKRWDLKKLRALLDAARKLTTERDARLARILPATKPSAEQQERNLRDNLTALGLEG